MRNGIVLESSCFSCLLKLQSFQAETWRLVLPTMAGDGVRSIVSNHHINQEMWKHVMKKQGDSSVGQMNHPCCEKNVVTKENNAPTKEVLPWKKHLHQGMKAKKPDPAVVQKAFYFWY